MPVDITNRSLLRDLFSRIDPGMRPLWGKMSPQHAVEHLSMVMKVSTGEVVSPLFNSEEAASRMKAIIIGTDKPLRQDIKNPLMGEEPPPLVQASFSDALDEMFNEIEKFQAFYDANPEATHTQPMLGKLNYFEWLVLHNKHFHHHLRQFDVTEYK